MISQTISNELASYEWIRLNHFGLLNQVLLQSSNIFTTPELLYYKKPDFVAKKNNS
jgi:hypothetical protein